MEAWIFYAVVCKSWDLSVAGRVPKPCPLVTNAALCSWHWQHVLDWQQSQGLYWLYNTYQISRRSTLGLSKCLAIIQLATLPFSWFSDSGCVFLFFLVGTCSAILSFGGGLFTPSWAGGFGTVNSVGTASHTSLFFSLWFMNCDSSKCTAQKTQFVFRYWADLCLRSSLLEFWTHFLHLTKTNPALVSCHKLTKRGGNNQCCSNHGDNDWMSDIAGIYKMLLCCSLCRQISTRIVDPYLDSSFGNRKNDSPGFFRRELAQLIAEQNWPLLLRFDISPAKWPRMPLQRCSLPPITNDRRQCPVLLL